MITTEQIQSLLSDGGAVLDEDGSKIGKIGQVYLDDQTGKPEWVTAKSGIGGGESFIPLASGTVDGSDIRVPYDKDKVKDAPRLEADGHLSQDQESELYRYYGMKYSEDTSDSGLPADGAPPKGGKPDDAVGHDTSGPTTDDAMTRSEEHLRVGTQKQESGTARLRKFVVTENVTQTVPVSHEEVRIEREPITDANRDTAMAGPEISDEEHEVTLTEERVVTEKQTVPVERVRMDTEAVTEDQEVSEQVRKEQIEADTGDGTEHARARDRAREERRDRR
ncbi:DUF2382 domain-containing protein [Agromyces laixinhei]|uniref:DUF2382 domain-containing protein n=1 Tax=Agromyces laixinhei TaxID=2585717 RepID=UPI0012ED7B55|nr:PRC and DUF2382 domain-containing protein [Agromyces laixinhei]